MKQIEKYDIPEDAYCWNVCGKKATVAIAIGKDGMGNDGAVFVCDDVLTGKCRFSNDPQPH